MKKTIYLICFSLMGLSAISCQKEKMTAEPKQTQDPIVFSVQAPQTKGQPQLNTLSMLAMQDFSVSAWYSEEGESFDSSSIPYIINNRFGTMAEAASESSTWQGISRDAERNKTPNPVYYPLAGSLSFFCYAPYSENDENSAIQIINKPETNITSRLDDYLQGSPLIRFTPYRSSGEQIDFVASDPVLDWKKGNGVVNLDFTKHLTSKIQFHCNYTGVKNDEEKILITKIQIHNVVGSEYMYFTQKGDQLGHQWCSDISPDDGTENMPLETYVLSTDDGSLDNSAYLNEGPAENSYKYVNNTPQGLMYVLPQAFKDPVGKIQENDPQLFITYNIINGDQVVEENVLKYDLRGTEAWPIGQTVAYYITLSIKARKELIVNRVVIEDWIDAGNMHNPEEILY